VSLFIVPPIESQLYAVELGDDWESARWWVNGWGKSYRVF
jgi:hypothetical protein